MQDGASVLFMSDDESLCVVDIPTSIAVSQYLELPKQLVKPLSIVALDQPYPSTEPKSEKARANLLARMESSTLERNRDYADYCHKGLERLRSLYNGPWCAARIVDQTSTIKRAVPRKRSRSPSERYTGGPDRCAESNKSVILDSRKDAQSYAIQELEERLVRNISRDPTKVLIRKEVDEALVIIPPCSMFCTSNINPRTVEEFTKSVRGVYSEPSRTAAPGQFDIVLIDPPWPNRSASRGKQYPTFQFSHNGEDALSALSSVLPSILAPQGIIAIWITNKASSRERAVNLLENVGVALIEEWIWLKITTNGEPVYDINGLYRQPWETCLIGRANHQSEDTLSRRLLVACTEHHSRKPWLGGMLADFYSKVPPGELRKLEIFARCTAAGWCAWGDDPVLFNSEKWWNGVE